MNKILFNIKPMDDIFSVEYEYCSSSETVKRTLLHDGIQVVQTTYYNMQDFYNQMYMDRYNEVRKD